MRFWFLFIATLLLAGCNSYCASAPNAHLSDFIAVIVGFNDQLQTWHGTPYRYGDMSRSGVDCSGFVSMTVRDKLDLQPPRDTRTQPKIGTEIDKDDLLSDDLVFSKTGFGESGLHVGTYDTNNQFIHASTSRGVMRSSLDNVYWRKSFWQVRRI